MLLPTSKSFFIIVSLTKQVEMNFTNNATSDSY